MKYIFTAVLLTLSSLTFADNTNSGNITQTLILPDGAAFLSEIESDSTRGKEGSVNYSPKYGVPSYVKDPDLRQRIENWIRNNL